MWREATLHFAADHPSVAGHFPSHPIVPGALILDEVVMAIAGTAHNGHVMIRTTKFLIPLRPGENVTLRWQTLASGKVTFECTRAGDQNVAVTGMIELQP